MPRWLSWTFALRWSWSARSNFVQFCLLRPIPSFLSNFINFVEFYQCSILSFASEFGFCHFCRIFNFVQFPISRIFNFVQFSFCPISYFANFQVCPIFNLSNFPFVHLSICPFVQFSIFPLIRILSFLSNFHILQLSVTVLFSIFVYFSNFLIFHFIQSRLAPQIGIFNPFNQFISFIQFFNFV